MTRTTTTAVTSVIVALLALASGAPARAATVPTGFQEYHVIGQEQHVWNMFNRPVVGQGFAGYALSNAMLSVVSVTASSANQIIYYDHWEDNTDVTADGIPDFEQDIVNVQTQAQTLVLGDGNPANGDACAFIVGFCAGDIIAIGDTLTLNSNVNTGTGAAPVCGGAGNLQGCVPLNPRAATDIRFDGGDRMVTSGGPVSLVHVQEPTANLPGILGGAVEITSLQAIGAATSYSVPVGEDSRAGLGDPGPGIPFAFVDLNLVSFEDNTSVQVQSPGAGTVSFTLNAGEHWSSQGQIDSGPVNPAIALVINEGTKVSTDKPLAGMIFASAGGNRFYATREFALLPDILHSTDYITTAPGDNPAGGNNPKEVYVYNPDPFNTITVTYTDSLGTGTFTVPANTTVAYSSGAGAGHFAPNASTVRLTSDRNFWGVTAYDSQGTAYDWGHSWLATAFLTDTYTVPFAPDNPAGPPGASPVFVSATTNNTCVQVDFDNNGVFDQVGNGTGGLLPFSPGTCVNGYFLDAPGATAVNPNALRIYDNNAADGTPNNDITGARVVANKPVALGYGLDTDLAPPSGAGILDLGYWIYPVSQKFLDPVLVVDKSSDVTTVPTAGGPVTYTIEVEAFGFGPLTTLQALDLLPVGVGTLDYVAGSTVITNPDLTLVTGAAADPATSIVGGRVQLDWSAALAANVDTLQTNETLTVQYTVNLPAGASGVLTNEATAIANLGTSVFQPTDTTDVMRTDVVFSKAVTDDGSPEAGENLTYTLSVINGGAGAETNVVITDSLPVDTTFAPGSIVDAGPFTGAYDAGQNAVVWTAANFPAAPTQYDLSFRAAINPAAPAGTVITNTADFESTLTVNFDSNTTSTTLGGPTLVIAKSALGNPNPVHPNEVVTFEITVENAGTGAANNVAIEDFFPVNGTYVANSMQWRLNAGAFSALTDVADADEGTAFVNRVEFLLAQLGPGQDIAFRFQVAVDPGTSGANFSNQATVSSDEVAASDTNLLQLAIDGDATITGHLFVDLDGNGVQGAAEPNMANVDVMVTDEDGGTQTVSTDGLGNYTVTVPADNAVGTGQTTLLVDVSDPDFLNGAVLTAGANPQVIIAFSGATVASAAVGYQPLPLTISKLSSAGGLVAPGDTLTYTINIDNYSGTNQSAVAVTDPLPAGVTFVPGSTQVTAPSMRLTEYFVDVGSFPGTTLTLVLNQNLASDYFVIIQGSDGSGGNGGDRGPDENYAALTSDPFGTGDLPVSGAPNTIGLTRGNAVNNWVGVITVVESLANAGGDGFQLLDVQRVVHAGAGTSGSDTSSTAWSDINQVMLMGGFNGAGCDTAEPTDNDTPVCHARLFPSGTDSIDWTRDGTTAALTTATSTVMVLEWGADWTVQRVRVQGNNGGNGANAPGEYNTSAIASVVRDNTWVWGSGHTSDNGPGDSAEGVLLTLGNGAAQNANETLLAAGIEHANNALDFEVYALTHPELSADYRFKTDGNSAVLTFDLAVDLQTHSRMALSYNGGADTGDNHPRTMFSARYLDNATVRLQRRRSNTNFPAWVQGIGYAGVLNTLPGGAPANLVPGAANYELPPGTRMTVTYQVIVDDPIAPAITQISNTATVASNESIATSDTVIDNVERPQINVEPNAAGTVLASPGTQTITFSHSVSNDGTSTDSFTLNAFSARGWTVEVLDPATLTVIATDSNGDGSWDGAAPNTGSMAGGDSVNYLVRVTVPGGTAIGIADTVELRATSDLRANVRGSAFDEIAVADGSVAGAGDVLVIPDSASNAAPGERAVYTHSITNLMGITDIFDLSASSSQGWTTTIYRDTNGDGVFTSGVDTAISNSASLAGGASQTIFVVVDVPPGATAGTVDSTAVTARSRTDPALGGIASDTTTVGAANSAIGFDFSGGGSQVVAAGATPVYAGTLSNLDAAADSFEFTISGSVYGPGGGVSDGLNHASQLWVDTTADGVADTQIATDDDGDGLWDFVDPGFDVDTDGNPDVMVAGNTALFYELRRPVDAAQSPYRDPVTLTAASITSGAAESVTATTAVLLATRAVISSFSAYGSVDGVTVQWQTSSEHGTVGFHLMRFDESSGRYSRVNKRLLPGLLHSRNGGIYRFVDPLVSANEIVTYELVELESTGQQITYGPYTVLVAVNAEAAGAETTEALDRPVKSFERVMRAQSALQEARMAAKTAARQQARTAKLAREGARAKITVRDAGAYYLSSDRIAEVLGLTRGETERRIGEGRLELRNRGAPIATLAAAANAGLYFYGEAISSQYTLDNVYWLSEGKGLAMANGDGQLPAAVSGGTFSHTSRAEGNRYSLTHLFDDPDGDYWMWDFRFEDMIFPTYESAYSVPSPGVAANGDGVARLTVRLHGGSQTDLDADHRATIALNGEELGSVEFDGLSPASATFELPLSLLNDGDNQVTVSGRASGIVDQPSIFYINDFALTYPRRYRSEDDALAFSSAGHPVVSLDGFGTDNVQIWNLRNPRRPRRIVNANIEALGDDYRVSFATPRIATPYIGFTNSAARTPSSVIADRPSDLKRRYHAVDYVLITASDLTDAAQDLLDIRRAQGLRAMVVDIEDVYDEFHYGIEDADAIWSFLHHAHTRWRSGPRYVVLAGEGSFDYKNYLGHGDSIVPTLLTPTPRGLFPSDNLYADVVGNDWLPEMAIGRLPVIDAAELVAMAAKIAAYEQSSGDWEQRMVVAADFPDLGGDFPTDSDFVAGLIPADYGLERIHLDEMLPGDARSRMLSAFADGRAFVNFFGHSGHRSIGNTDLINVLDVPGLENAERLPVVTAFTCLAGQFGFPGQESIAETLLITSNGGAAAIWSPSGLSLNNRARLLSEGFYTSTFGRGELVIGEAILEAQAHYARDGIDKYLLDVYNLIGDPATIMK